jgi:hypothetical protein
VILFSLLGLLAGGFARIGHHHFPDDAYITYRYARNLADGLGMAYNPGERILGTTTPFYASILSWGVLLGIAPVFLSGLIDFFTFGLMLFFILRIVRRVFSGLWWLWFWAALVLNPSYISLTGMETWFYSFLIYFTFWSLLKERPWGTSLGSVMCALVRPDGLLVWMIIFPILIYRYITFPEEKRKIYRYPILIGLLFLLAGLLLPTLYFGSWLPESIIVKQEQVTLHGSWKSYFTGIFEKYHYPNGFPTPLMLIMLGGLIWGIIHNSQLRPLLVWGLVYQLFLILGRAPWYEWYETPVIPWFFLCIVIFWRRINQYALELFGEKEGGAAKLRIQSLVLLVSFICLFPPDANPPEPGSLSYIRKQRTSRKTGYMEAGLWIAKHTPLGAEVAAVEIGVLGYYSGRKIYDLIGIVSPDPGLLHRKTSQWDIVGEKGCDYVIYPFANLPGDFLSIPSKLFWHNYRIEGIWHNMDEQGVFEIPILFGKHNNQPGESLPLLGNISAPLRKNETGLVILNLTPYTALKGVINTQPPKSVIWTFIANSGKTRLEFTPMILPPHVFGGECLIEEGAGGDDWREKVRFPVNAGEPVRCEITSICDRPVIRITLLPDRFPDSQGFYLLDATTTDMGSRISDAISTNFHLKPEGDSEKLIQVSVILQ